MKKIAILGSTGSIGTQALDIIRKYPEDFEVVALTAGRNLSSLASQVKEFGPNRVCIADEDRVEDFKDMIKGDIKVCHGDEGLRSVAGQSEADIVINALVGSVGLMPTIMALEAGAIVALANKETMVAGGELIKNMPQETRDRILPVDSEHSAIFQCLIGEQRKDLRKILLTGSGGPFLDTPTNEMAEITVNQALQHPRWVMGPKITIDSSTLMNKGLEVIEAHYLFSIEYDDIEVVIHPQSIIHSMVEFRDGSIKAHLGYTDMKIPIQYALSYPERLDSELVGLDFVEVGALTFKRPDSVKFPCLRLAYECGRKEGTFPAVLNAANEETVAAFLAGQIGYVRIAEINERVVGAYSGGDVNSYEDIVEAEKWARRQARSMISKAGV